MWYTEVAASHCWQNVISPKYTLSQFSFKLKLLGALCESHLAQSFGCKMVETLTAESY